MQKAAHSQLHPNGIFNKTWTRFKYSVCIICIPGTQQLLLHEVFSCLLGRKLRQGNGSLHPGIQTPCIQNNHRGIQTTGKGVQISPFSHIPLSSTRTQIFRCMFMHCSAGVFPTTRVISLARTTTRVS